MQCLCVCVYIYIYIYKEGYLFEILIFCKNLLVLCGSIYHNFVFDLSESSFTLSKDCFCYNCTPEGSLMFDRYYSGGLDLVHSL